MQKKKYFWELPFLVISLSAFGLLLTWSAEKTLGWQASVPFGKHLFFTILGLLGMLLCSFVNMEKFKKAVPVLGGVAIILMLLLKTPFSYSIYGSTRWLMVGGASFRPAEWATVAFILVFALVMEKLENRKDSPDILYFLWFGAMTVALFLCAMTNNMNHLVAIGAITFVITMVCSKRVKFHLLTLGVVLGGVVFLIWYLCRQWADGFRLMRLKAWLDPYAYRYDAGYVAVQQLEAVKRGGWFGMGLGNGLFVKNDVGVYDGPMVVVCEELGWLAAILLAGVFILLLYQIYRILKLAVKAENDFTQAVAAGILAHVGVTAFVCMGKNLNLLPAGLGILPFVSYPGLTCFTTYCEMGLVLAIAKSYNGPMEQKKVEETEMNQLLEKKYLKLQNGSDVRGVALEGIEGESVNLTPEIAKYIAAAFAEYLSEKCGKEQKELTISVGHDSRLSAEMLKNAVLEGIQKQGCQPMDCGLASTPSMFMSTVLPQLSYDGAIMITASHLPFNRNGLKFFSKEGGLESKEIKIILNKAIALEEGGIAACEEKEIQKLDLIAHYSANLRKIICEETETAEEDQPLKGMHFVVDASNGAGGFFASQVLEPLGADISGSIYLDPDGTFPNHVPNPENAKAMESIKSATLENKADLGIIFDTDVDRAATVFPSGKEINKNALIALMASIVAQKMPGSTVVTDSVTSDQLEDFLVNRLGLKHHRFKRGYRNVINESVRLNNEGIPSGLAIETSGHGALKENYFLDDGAYMSVKILCEVVKCKRAGKNIEDLLEGLEEAADCGEFRLGIQLEEFKEYGLRVLDDFKAFAEGEESFHIVEPNFEGVRISFKDEEVHGWLLLRLSLHDPILPMNIETNEAGGVEIVLKRIRPFFEKYEHLNIASLM